jgi:hypothetical protein
VKWLAGECTFSALPAAQAAVPDSNTLFGIRVLTFNKNISSALLLVKATLVLHSLEYSLRGRRVTREKLQPRKNFTSVKTEVYAKFRGALLFGEGFRYTCSVY